MTLTACSLLDYFSQHLGEYLNVLSALESLNVAILKAMDKTKEVSLVLCEFALIQASIVQKKKKISEEQWVFKPTHTYKVGDSCYKYALSRFDTNLKRDPKGDTETAGQFKGFCWWNNSELGGDLSPGRSESRGGMCTVRTMSVGEVTRIWKQKETGVTWSTRKDTTLE